MESDLYIGVISGTSMDGIDAVLTKISDKRIETLAHHSLDYSTQLREELINLCTPGADEIQRMGESDIQVGLLIAKTINRLLEQEGLESKDIRAIGSHGQTIRHSVETNNPFTLQIGNPSIISEKTGITTIADFRMADIAAGGQGAPLAPGVHDAIFRSDSTRIILNLGGIANITILDPTKQTIGYDTGPANTLMDQWIGKHQHLEYDKDGAWASTGCVITSLLDALLKDDYILLPAPKSTGREYFQLDWLQSYLDQLPEQAPEDIQRTLLEYSAITIADEINQRVQEPTEIYLCGGGSNNTFFVDRLNSVLSKHKIKLTDELGVHTQQVEATAFAWLAHQTMEQLAGNLPAVTGAQKSKVLGGIYPAS